MSGDRKLQCEKFSVVLHVAGGGVKTTKRDTSVSAFARVDGVGVRNEKKMTFFLMTLLYCSHHCQFPGHLAGGVNAQADFSTNRDHRRSW